MPDTVLLIAEWVLLPYLTLTNEEIVKEVIIFLWRLSLKSAQMKELTLLASLLVTEQIFQNQKKRKGIEEAQSKNLLMVKVTA